ncbi:MAG: AMP-binding protein, partial [Rhodospirillaceae bacterium]|nr:AMP-binding protein [Rhodospirillaceae bacterium]
MVVNSRKDPAFPLSAPQTSIWADCAANPEDLDYNVSDILDFIGPLNCDALISAVRHTDQEADCLRLRISMDGPTPVQSFSTAPLPFDFAIIDLTAASDPEAQATREAESVRKQPFDLTHGPLARHRLLRLSATHHRWVRVYHHLVMDGYSSLILCSHTEALYNAIRRGETLSPVTLPSYRTFLEDDHAYPNTLAYTRDLTYWRERLKDDRPANAFPSTQPKNGPHQTCLSRTLSVARLDALAQTAKAIGVSTTSLMKTTFLALLGQVADTDQPVVLSAHANRQTRTERASIGQFAVLTPVSADFTHGITFREATCAIHTTSQRDMRHIRLSPSRMRAAGIGVQSLSNLDCALFNALDFPQTLNFDDLLCRIPRIFFGPTPNVSLSFVTYGHDKGDDPACLLWNYATDRFDAAAITRLADRFDTLLEAVAHHPNVRVEDLPRLSPNEEACITAWEVAPPSPPLSTDDLLLHRIRAQASTVSDRIAVTAPDGTLTYGALLSRANAMARHLANYGIGHGDVVGLCLEASTDLIAGMLGIMTAGATVMPLDPRLPSERLSKLSTRAKAVLIHAATQNILKVAQATLILTEKITNTDAIPPSVTTAPTDIAFIYHTSGSTGTPKAVPITHAMISRKIRDIATTFGFGGPDVPETVCVSAAISFDPWMQQIFLGLTNGGHLWLPEYLTLLDPSAFWNALSKAEVTHLNLSPTLIDGLLDTIPNGLTFKVRRAVFGGETLRPDLAAQVAAFVKPHTIWNMYGPTETTIDATGFPLLSPPTQDELPIGSPLPGYVLRVLDAHQRRVAIGEVGELYIGGTGLAAGYLDTPDIT